MKQQVVVIHGGNAFETYDEYLSHLKNKEMTLEELQYKDWKKNLGDVLGDTYQVISPLMPNFKNARYLEWKIWFEKLIPLFDDTVILVGHSLGGLFFAKYLSENIFPKTVKATHLVAAPYNTEHEHPIVDFIITNDLAKVNEQGGDIHLYQSKDDFVVPYSNLLSYQNALPDAQVHTFENKGHFLQEEFPELVDEIRKLK
jgi:predicted alpha/beta hydrolase family esterase